MTGATQPWRLELSPCIYVNVVGPRPVQAPQQFHSVNTEQIPSENSFLQFSGHVLSTVNSDFNIEPIMSMKVTDPIFQSFERLGGN